MCLRKKKKNLCETKTSSKVNWNNNCINIIVVYENWKCHFRVEHFIVINDILDSKTILNDNIK